MMTHQIKLRAQRSDIDIFAFRRLKWAVHQRVPCGLRFVSAPWRVDQAIAAIAHDDKVQNGVAVAAELPTDMPQDSAVTDLDKRREREQIVDAVAWAAVIVSALAGALILTGSSQ